MKIKLQIKNRFTGSIIFEFETENNTIAKTINEYVRQAKKNGNIFSRADLTDANLTDADLTDANLSRANLTRANLTDANLTDANLLRFKSDFWRVLLMNKEEVVGLRQSLFDGKVNGSAYEGDCVCLKGTLANVKGCKIEQIPGMIKDVSEPSEQWFLQIKPEMTPHNSGVVKLTVAWIDEFLKLINRPTKEVTINKKSNKKSDG